MPALGLFLRKVKHRDNSVKKVHKAYLGTILLHHPGSLSYLTIPAIDPPIKAPHFPLWLSHDELGTPKPV